MATGTITRYRTVVLDRIVFCSEACMHNALIGDTLDEDRKVVYIGETIARDMKCYGCGFWLDEATKG